MIFLLLEASLLLICLMVSCFPPLFPSFILPSGNIAVHISDWEVEKSFLFFFCKLLRRLTWIFSLASTQRHTQFKIHYIVLYLIFTLGNVLPKAGCHGVLEPLEVINIRLKLNYIHLCIHLLFIRERLRCLTFLLYFC